jgi:hypothetical protein
VEVGVEHADRGDRRAGRVLGGEFPAGGAGVGLHGGEAKGLSQNLGGKG